MSSGATPCQNYRALVNTDSAVISKDGRYRYALTRQCAAGYHILCRAFRAGQCACRCHEAREAL